MSDGPSNVVVLKPRVPAAAPVMASEQVSAVAPTSIATRRLQNALDDKVAPILVREVGRWPFYAPNHIWPFFETDFRRLPEKDTLAIAHSIDRILKRLGVNDAKIMPKQEKGMIIVKMPQPSYDMLVSRCLRDAGDLPTL